ncbi:Outer membrane protein TolC [Pseudobutyrivibrio sp. JW11]|uniref:hypothetical protein n=1 Tax=Pseudobutyrivibrio sp. JW11 TaxID=1855302 RepID=UPI0008E734FE|nr:hypothetical protein [Pseudobutyrivibrio sp. JW11]SFN83249.1 Outer membrane protein TolC [Pseudobutyrivibrio sp. JW11]
MELLCTKSRINKAIAFILIVVFLSNSISVPRIEAAGSNTLTIDIVKALALANSEDLEALLLKYDQAQIQYKSAVKSAYEKYRKIKSFSWSPLLSFKLPQKPTEAENYDYQFTAIEKQAEIDKIEQELDDKVFAVYETAGNLYTKIYTLQEQIKYETAQLEILEEQIGTTQLQVVIGTAKQSDLDKMNTKKENLTTSLASHKNTKATSEKELGKIINLTIPAEVYTYIAPYVESTLDRALLDNIIDYTKDRDRALYEAEVIEEVEKLAAETNFNLYKGHYAKDIHMIQSYYDTIMSGGEVNKTQFKKAYAAFLKQIDSYWVGKKTIKIGWFIKISFPKEWTKKTLDGIRYIDDDPYVCYDSLIEYMSAHKERVSIENQLETNLTSGFDNITTLRNTYKAYVKDQTRLSVELDDAYLLNKSGKLTYEEYTDLQTSYEETQMNTLKALDDYTRALYSYDRTTCGAITFYLLSGDAALYNSIGGDSFLEAETLTGPKYYIRTLVAKNGFRMGVSIPENFDKNITHFELWVGNEQIGERTPIGYEIRHLAIGKINGEDRVFIRLYDGDTFVSDCDIDPRAYEGELIITDGYVESPKKTYEVVAGYSFKSAQSGVVSFRLKDVKDKDIKYYKLLDSTGSPLIDDELTSVDDEFRYLTMLLTDIDNVQIEMYDVNKELLYQANFNSAEFTVVKEVEVEEEDE